MEKNHCRKKEKEDKILPPSILASSPPRPCREGFLTELYLLIWPMQFKRSKGDGCNRNSIHKWKVLRILLDSGSRPGHAVRAWFTQEISHLAVTQSPSHSLPLPSEARAPFHSLGISKKVFWEENQILQDSCWLKSGNLETSAPDLSAAGGGCAKG